MISTSYNLAIFKVKSDLSRTSLNYLWILIEPILYVTMYYIIFQLGFRGGNDINFLLFLMIGLIFWLWVAKSIAYASNSLISRDKLIQSFAINSFVLPLSRVIEKTIYQLPTIIILLIFILIMNVDSDIDFISLLLLIFLQFNFIVFISALGAYSVLFFRDLKYLISPALTFMLFMSGIFYDYREMPENLQFIFLYNPIVHLLDLYRMILLYNDSSNALTLIVLIMFMIIINLSVIWLVNIWHNHIIIKNLQS